jgi:hypothetical protein
MILGKFEREKETLLSFVDNVSKNNRLIVELLVILAAFELVLVCDSFFARIFNTEANAGNK